MVASRTLRHQAAGSVRWRENRWVGTLQLSTDSWMRWAEPAALVGDETRAIGLLSADERSRYATTLSASARERLLWGRLLLRELVAEQIGCRPAEVTIDARCTDCGGPHGRPVATGPSDEARALSLSVSACAGMVLVATSLGRPIGIDVEPCAVSAGQLQGIRQVAGDTEHPLRHWTRIEAVLKADGRALRVDPRQVRVTTHGAELEGTLYRFAEPDFDPRFVLSSAFGPAYAPGVGAAPGSTARRRTTRRAVDRCTGPHAHGSHPN